MTRRAARGLPPRLEVRGEVLQVVLVIDGKRRRISTGLTDTQAHRREAEAYRKTKQAQIDADAAPLPAGVTIDDVIARMVERMRDRKVKTVDEVASLLRRYVLPALGRRLADEITRDEWRALIVRLRDGVLDPVLRDDGSTGPMTHKIAVATVLHVHRYTRQAFKEALDADPPLLSRTRSPIFVERGLLKKVKPDVLAEEAKNFTREEIVVLLSSPVIPWDRRVFYALLFFFGLRSASEAAALRWSDFDTAAQPLASMLVTSPKTGAARRLPCHPVLTGMLLAWRERGFAETFGRMPSSDDLIVPPTADRKHTGGKLFTGTQRTKEYTWHRWNLDLPAAGLAREPRRTPHRVRHSFVSLAVADGASASVVEQFTHTSPSMRSTAFTSYLHPAWAGMVAELLKLRIDLPHVEAEEEISAAAPLALQQASAGYGSGVATSAREPRTSSRRRGGGGRGVDARLTVVAAPCEAEATGPRYTDATGQKKGSVSAAFWVTPPGIEPGFLG